MKSCRLLVLALGACTVPAHAQSDEVYRLSVPASGAKHSIAVIDVTDLREPGMADTATRVFGYPGKRLGLGAPSEARSFSMSDAQRQPRHSRAWGMSVGIRSGLLTLRVAHQNKNVARVAPAMHMGNRTDAKNSLIAAHVDLGPVKAYTAYSANRGWGSSPLFNPDNPYGATMASTPSTDSRDVLVGIAVPMGRTTLLASLIRKNDRDLANRDAAQFAIGATYMMSRRTDWYAAWSRTALQQGMAGNPVAPTAASSALNMGMRHAF